MADREQLRVYIQYDILLATDLRYIVGGIEQAYNQVASFFQDTRRVRSKDRLQIKSIHTERSLETFLSGNGQTIVGLVFLLLGARHLYWKTQKVKWDAKLAERKFRSEEYLDGQERMRAALQKQDVSLAKAAESLERVARRIFQSPRIASIQINLVDEDTSLRKPAREVSLEDEL